MTCCRNRNTDKPQLGLNFTWGQLRRLCCMLGTPHLQSAPFGGIEHQESAKDPLTVCGHIEGHAVLSPQHTLPQLLLATSTACYTDSTFRIQHGRTWCSQTQTRCQLPVANTRFKDATRGIQQSGHISESFKPVVEILTFPTHKGHSVHLCWT